MKQIYLYLMKMFTLLILVTIMIMLSVAFLTLLERKFLGYIQMRKGPNKISIMGMLQPFSDAIKLLSKEFSFAMSINFIYYIFSPILSLVLILMMWMIYPIWVNFMIFKLGLVYLLCCFSLGVYGLLMSGWSSNSSYSMLGSIRGVSQSISYEVSLAIILIIPMLMLNKMNFIYLFNMQMMGGWNMMFMWPLGVMFFFSIMAELNRTPFDFSEGESELVSGFNIEYSSVGFILIFLSEYASIMFLSFLFSIFFLGGDYMDMNFYLKILFLSIMVIWIRGTMPRFRYDLLMYLCWMIILPISLNYMFYMIILKFYMFK
uniref:NADH dehydrogenase subunit 1 n=1 Tax=Gotra octocincta TaxID=3029099 RepID=UPI0023D7FC9E|nr:NADH dehydrogenase subunit 1 [Gotra octocincta]WDQ40363.1 NADH dehydrogenase subunit 1 [Gotra octocincta]